MTWLLSLAVGLVACGGGREAPALPPPGPSRVADRGRARCGRRRPRARPRADRASAPARLGALAAGPEFCATRLEELGYQVARVSYGSGVNVIGSAPAASLRTSTWCCLSATGPTRPGLLAGADDNATRAATLEAGGALAAGTRRRGSHPDGCMPGRRGERTGRLERVCRRAGGPGGARPRRRVRDDRVRRP